MKKERLAIGKLPPDFLKEILKHAPILDDRILSGPGVGIDCAVVEYGSKILALKTDPITFVSDEIGWYAVQVCANDIVTTGAKPLWYLATVLFPENDTTEKLVKQVAEQLYQACENLGISVIGGHTEVTSGLDRTIVVGTMIGEVDSDGLVSPKNAVPGDHILLTKGVPIEATALLAREFPQRLERKLKPSEIQEAVNYLYDPGISVVKDAQIAIQAVHVHAMHDPTEGGLAAALWEMSDACGYGIRFDPQVVHIPGISKKICEIFKIDPLASIASGALLLAVPEDDVARICAELSKEGINCMDIGIVDKHTQGITFIENGNTMPYPRPTRDEIAKLFD